MHGLAALVDTITFLQNITILLQILLCSLNDEQICGKYARLKNYFE
jgi:hypothetical protein